MFYKRMDTQNLDDIKSQGSTLAAKPRREVTSSPKQEYQ